MSIGNLFIANRTQGNNVHTNTLVLSKLSEVERDELEDQSEGSLVYNDSVNKLQLKSGPDWVSVSTVLPTGPSIAVWVPTANSTYASGIAKNPCRPGNSTQTVTSGGLVITANGDIAVTVAGLYRVEWQATIRLGAPITAGGISISIRNFDGAVNYAQYDNQGYTIATSSLTQMTFNMMHIISLPVGGTIAPFVTNNLTGANFDVVGGVTTPLLTFCMIQFIG